VIATLDAELAIDVRAELGEGPIWDERGAALLFVDIMRGRVHRFEPSSGAIHTFDVGQPVGAVGLAEDDRQYVGEGFVLAVRDGFAWLEKSTGRVTPIADVERDRPDQRMNDGACDAAGRFWAGTMAVDERPGAGALYRLDPDGSVTRMVDRVTISNGIGWSADNARMYFIDSAAGRVDLFDFDLATGAIANRRPFVLIPPGAGLPDGLAVDAEDHVWVTLWGGGAVHRYAPDASLSSVVRVRATHPTSCCFGGGDMADLYITTASIALDQTARERQPHAGGVFRVRAGVGGRAPYRYRRGRARH
jgi:sugar lactone lactonase YvrE